MVEHCLEYFLFKDVPSISLFEKGLEDGIDLNEIFMEEFEPKSEPSCIQIKGKNLYIQDILLKRSHENMHKAHFCAHNRVVTSEPLSSRVSHLNGFLYDEEGSPLLYTMYISGDFLDSCVEDDRTDFRMPRRSSSFTPETICWNDVLSAAIEHAN